MPLHPAWVKNISRRVLWAALEKEINRVDRSEMLTFFKAKCAYCGRTLGARWHADHLIPVDSGGLNHISNRVPACPCCNENEKRAQNWETFLAMKCGSNHQLLSSRRSLIATWIKRKMPSALPVTEEQRAVWRRETFALATAIDSAWERLKSVKG